jgi:xanthosine utilization system XapX-like protein
MNKKTVLTLVAGVVLGIVFAPQVSKLPLVNRLPQF